MTMPSSPPSWAAMPDRPGPPRAGYESSLRGITRASVAGRCAAASERENCSPSSLCHARASCSARSRSACSSRFAIGTPVMAASSQGRGKSSIFMTLNPSYATGPVALPVVVNGEERKKFQVVFSTAMPAPPPADRSAGAHAKLDGGTTARLAMQHVVIWAGRLAGHAKQAAKRPGCEAPRSPAGAIFVAGGTQP
jgi:hypothetical protein